MPRTASWKWHHWWSVTQLRTDRSLYYPGYQKTVSRPPPPSPLYLLVHNLSSHPNFPPYISNKKFLSLQLNSFVCSQWEILIESLQNFQSSVFEPLQTAHFSDEKFIEPNCRLEVQLNRKREIEADGWIVSTATAILLGEKVTLKRWSHDHLEKIEFMTIMIIVKQLSNAVAEHWK